MTSAYVNDGTVTTASQSIEQSYTAYVDGGASFTIANGVSYTLATPVIDNATFMISTGTSSPGTTLVLNVGTVIGTDRITFGSKTGTLVIGIDTLPTIDIQATDSASPTLVANPSLGAPLIGHFGGTIVGFKTGDTIIVDTTVAATFHTDANNPALVDVVEASNTGVVLGSPLFNAAGSATAAASNIGTELIDVVVQCFAAGTAIRTEHGDVAVRALKPGDRVYSVLTQRHVPVTWIGHRHIDCSRHPRPAEVWPVRIAADTFGPGAPVRDVFLSPDHAVHVEDVLLPVR